MRLAALYVHPVKSARGVSVREAEVLPRGLRHDRRWMITNEAGRFVTQRNDPRLGGIVPSLHGPVLRLAAPGTPPLELPAEPEGSPTRRVTVWNDEVQAVDAGDAAAAWLAGVLGPGHRLVGLPPGSRRPLDPAKDGADAEVSFADGYPFLLTGAASLREVERRAGLPLVMERFRPNLVVEGAAPFAEDRWRTVRIGNVRFRIAGPCERCVLTTRDPITGEHGREPLRTLATFRKTSSGGVAFGQNLLADDTGRVRIGDEVVVEASSDPR